MNRGGRGACALCEAGDNAGEARRCLKLWIRSPLPASAIGLSETSFGMGPQKVALPSTLTPARETTNFFLWALSRGFVARRVDVTLGSRRGHVGSSSLDLSCDVPLPPAVTGALLEIEPPKHGAACVLHVVDAQHKVDLTGGHRPINAVRAR